MHQATMRGGQRRKRRREIFCPVNTRNLYSTFSRLTRCVVFISGSSFLNWVKLTSWVLWTRGRDPRTCLPPLHPSPRRPLSSGLAQSITLTEDEAAEWTDFLRRAAVRLQGRGGAVVLLVGRGPSRREKKRSA